MANDVLGETFEVHAGGVDLCFPHHNNELAQGEAYGRCHEWVKHWWHVGHLHIDSHKMSKSLKNFVTIREVLARHSGRVVRLFFLSAPWGATVSYTEEGLKGAETKAREIDAFVANTREAVRKQEAELDQHPQLWTNDDRVFSATIVKVRADVDKALRDNFSYDVAMVVLARLMGDTNKYRTRLSGSPKSLLLRQSVDYVMSILGVLGVEIEGNNDKVDSNAQLDAIVSFRNQVRLSAGDAPKVMALCDEFRDNTMSRLGVRIEDNTVERSSSWRHCDAAQMARERDQAAAKQREQRERKLVDLRAQLEREMQASHSPATHLRAMLDPTDPTGLRPRFAHFDAATGQPTHDALGQPLAKSALKTVAKLWAKQEKAFAAYKPETAAQLTSQIANMLV